MCLLHEKAVFVEKAENRNTLKGPGIQPIKRGFPKQDTPTRRSPSIQYCYHPALATNRYSTEKH